jgi:hypothetical protein
MILTIVGITYIIRLILEVIVVEDINKVVRELQEKADAVLERTAREISQILEDRCGGGMLAPSFAVSIKLEVAKRRQPSKKASVVITAAQ